MPVKSTWTYHIRCKYLENKKIIKTINKTFDELLNLLQHGMGSEINIRLIIADNAFIIKQLLWSLDDNVLVQIVLVYV